MHKFETTDLAVAKRARSALFFARDVSVKNGDEAIRGTVRSVQEDASGALKRWIITVRPGAVKAYEPPLLLRREA